MKKVILFLHQIHPALWAFARFVTLHFRVHRTCVFSRALRITWIMFSSASHYQHGQNAASCQNNCQYPEIIILGGLKQLRKNN